MHIALRHTFEHKIKLHTVTVWFYSFEIIHQFWNTRLNRYYRVKKETTSLRWKLTNYSFFQKTVSHLS